MDVCIRPALLRGEITPPPSKSQAHRLLIAAALAEGASTVRGAALSDDIQATLRCMAALGAEWEQTAPGALRVRGTRGPVSGGPLPEFDCGESGSTLRFFLPLALALAGGGAFIGRGRLMDRPQRPYFELFDEKGVAYRQSAGVLTVEGRLAPGEYRLRGDVSSQFFTGLLLALPLLDGPSTLVSTTALESADYVAMTLEVLKTAGVAVRADADGRCFQIPAARPRTFDAVVEADWSQAAFWYAAALQGGEVRVCGLNERSAQGDRVVAGYFRQMQSPGDLEIDVSGCPDLVPPLAVMAAARRGTVRLMNAARLRLKESDRLRTTAAMVNALGGQAEEGADFLTVHGVPQLSGGIVDGANDHRIVMAAAIAAARCAGPVTILGAEAVRKSYPTFFEDYQALGGDAVVL